ncbi:MAG TPA: hypothetical protein PLT36_06310 [Erysipelotrichaceae bacterium]|nr:hypothetical protein [Erysipelotrichaceae bacterium]HQA84380.1 hypothetical protein [Erysipelotrichaceae bacterium]
MKELIKFDLRRRFINKTTTIVNILLFVMILCGFHIDYILKEETIINTVLVDTSLIEYSELFTELSDEHLRYKISDKENKKSEVILHLDEEWQIITKYELNESVKERITNDIKKVITEKYKLSHQFLSSFIDEYVNINPEIVVKSEEIIDGSMVIMLAISFFLIINYGCTSSNEIIIEKTSGVLNIILTNMNAERHLLEKIIVSYIIFIIQMMILICQLFASYLIRFVQDRCLGLQTFISRFLIVSATDVSMDLTVEKLMLIVLLMIFNLLLIQLIILLITSKYTNGQQMASFQGLLYVGLLIIYYLVMIFSEQLIKSKLISYLCYLPLFSMILIPQKIISSTISTFESILALMLVVIAIIATIIKGSDSYKRNLLIQK